MPFAAALSTAADTATAVREACEIARGQLGPQPADLAVVFVSPHHTIDGPGLAAALYKQLAPRALVGCQGESVVATGREIEDGPALSVWLADFGGDLTAEAFHLTAEATPDGPSLFGWPDGLDDADPATSAVVALGDPYTFPVGELFFPRLNEDHPGLAVFGGMASGAPGPGQTLLIKDAEAVDGGAVGVLLRGRRRWRGVVSQGCRPVGRPLVVTKAKDNVVYEVGGRPTMTVLREMYDAMPEPDQRLLERGGLHVGLATNEYRDQFTRGDFLIRNIYAIERESGAVVITDRVRVGQTVQFQLRDAASADEDLRALLRADRDARPAAGGALVFTCNGRGTRMFQTPDHDAGAIKDELGPIPTAGLFAAGELGPVGGRNFVHGFTASVLLFE